MTAGACAKSKAPPGDGDLPAGDAVGVGAVRQIYGHTAAGALQVEDAPNTASGPSYGHHNPFLHRLQLEAGGHG